MVNLITEHIDIWTAAQAQKANGGRGRGNNLNGNSQHGIKKLRELILELAVRGKLVPQDPKDEPASELLKKIAKEKARLIKEGKIKKQKPLPEIRKDEHPFELPKEWNWVRLGQIAQHNSGKTLDKGRNKGEKRKYITTSNLYWGYFILDNLREMQIREEELEKCTAKKDDLLICEGGEAGRASVWDNEDNICFQNHIHRVRLFCTINPYYVYRFFERINYTGEIDNYRKGVAISNLSGKTLSSIIIPLPPLSEQHRIVAKVDELMALCDRLEQQQIDSNAAHQTLVETLLATLTNAAGQSELVEAWSCIANHFDTLFTTEQSIDQLKQTMIELVVKGRLLKFPFDAKKYLVKELLTFGPRNGLSPKEASYETEIKVLKLGATTKGFLDLTESKYVDVDIENASHLWIGEGDILIQRGNAAQHVGCNVVVNGNLSNYIYPDLMMKLRVNDKVYPRYLSLCLSALPSREYMWKRMTGTSGTMPKISKKIVESIPLIIPDLKTQNNVLSLVDQLINLLDALKSGIKDAQTTQVQLADAIVKQAVA